jgi:cell division protein FtsB
VINFFTNAIGSLIAAIVLMVADIFVGYFFPRSKIAIVVTLLLILSVSFVFYIKETLRKENEKLKKEKCELEAQNKRLNQERCELEAQNKKLNQGKCELEVQNEKLNQEKYVLDVQNGKLTQEKHELDVLNQNKEGVLKSIEYFSKDYAKLLLPRLDAKTIPSLLANNLDRIKNSFESLTGSTAGRIRVAIKIIAGKAEKKKEYNGFYVYTLSRDRDSFAEHHDSDRNRGKIDSIIGNSDFHQILKEERDYYYNPSINDSRDYMNTSKKNGTTFSYESTIVVPIRVFAHDIKKDYDRILGFLAIDSPNKEGLRVEHIPLAQTYADLLVYSLSHLLTCHRKGLRGLFIKNPPKPKLAPKLSKKVNIPQQEVDELDNPQRMG